jgi:EAL domain-containing protein (putative c-di-GMP-specific phosphodiesterase class I)
VVDGRHMDNKSGTVDVPHLANDLRVAVDNHEIFLRYLPIVDLTAFDIIGAEALIRWRHPEFGVLEPSRFLPFVGDLGLDLEVGRWVLAEACLAGARWRDQGQSLKVSVNLFPAHLTAPGFVGDVRRALDASTLDPAGLVVEVASRSLGVRRGVVRARLQAVSALGAGVAIDGFGDQQVSLPFLRTLSADWLKIHLQSFGAPDGSWDTDPRLEEVLAAATSLGGYVVAQGIELPGDLQKVRAAGIDAGEGFLFAEPLDPTGLSTLSLPAPVR